MVADSCVWLAMCGHVVGCLACTVACFALFRVVLFCVVMLVCVSCV